MCEEQARLAKAYATASVVCWEFEAKLAAAPTNALLQEAESARIVAFQSRLEMERHVSEHGC